MPSSYSPRLRLELQATGENRSTWGVKANNDFSLIEAAIAGAATITLADANYTLSTANGLTDEARNAILIIGGTQTAKRTITIPSVSKVYVIKNQTTGGFDIDVKTSAGLSNTITITNGATRGIWSDGTSVYFTEVVPSSILPVNLGGTGSSTVGGAQTNLSVDNKVILATKGGNYTAVLADNNATHNYSAVATVSLTAAATLGANWHYTVIANGGDLTITPNGAETINGVNASIIVKKGHEATIYCTGTQFYTANPTPGAWEVIDIADVTAITIYAKTGLSAFRELRITFDCSIDTPQSGSPFWIQLSSDNGVSWIGAAGGTAYYTTYVYGTSAASTGGAQVSTNAFLLSLSSNVLPGVSSGGCHGTLTLTDFNKARWTHIYGPIGYQNTGTATVAATIEGGLVDNNSNNALRLTSGQNFSGRVILEGIRG